MHPRSKFFSKVQQKSLRTVLSILLAFSLLPAGLSAGATEAYATGAHAEEAEWVSGEQTAEASAAPTSETSEDPLSDTGRPMSAEEVAEQAASGGIVHAFDRSDENYNVGGANSKNAAGLSAEDAADSAANNDSDASTNATANDAQDAATSENAAFDTNAATSDNASAAQDAQESQAAQQSAQLAASLPSKVDLRAIGKVSPVKNQDYTCTCWAFGSLAAAETSIATSTGLSADSFSAFQPAFFGFHTLTSDITQLKGTEISQSGEGVAMKSGKEQDYLNYGATEFTAPSLIMQGCGPALDSSIVFPEDPLKTAVATSEYDLTQGQRRESVVRMTDFSYLGNIVNTRTDATGKKKYASTNDIVLNRAKYEISQGRAVAVSYFGDSPDYGQDKYIAQGTYAQYTYDYQSANHLVCVVGYDDDYPKENFIEGHQPPADGAFIVKNSWGSNWGVEGGYLYISYFDQSLADATVYKFDTSDYSGETIDPEAEIIDQYDYLPANVVLSWYRDNPEWYANIYTATQKQQLYSIGTYACDDYTNLEYQIYKLRPDAQSPLDVQGSLTEEPAAKGVCYKEYEGYVNIELDEPINLQEGEKYAIICSQKGSNDKYYAPVPINFNEKYESLTWSAKTVVNEGESFYSDTPNNEWKNWTTTNYNNYATDNFCVKGYCAVMDDVPFVVFESNGGTQVATQSVKKWSAAKEPAAPTREGYVFKGWYSDAALTTAYDFSATVEGDITLYAKWDSALQPGTQSGVERLAGDDVFGTNLATLRADVQENGTPSGIIVCTDASYVDSLSAAALSGLLDYPIVIVNGRDDSMNYTVQFALSIVSTGGSSSGGGSSGADSAGGSSGGAGSSGSSGSSNTTGKKLDVVILGGKASVSSGIEAQLAAYDSDGTCTRIWGETGYDTNIAAYDYGAVRGAWNADEVLVATGTDYYDALGAGSYAAAKRAFVLLTDVNGNNDRVYTRAANSKKATICGGTVAVPASIDESLSKICTVDRKAGKTALDTNAEFVKYATSQGMTMQNGGVSTVNGYWDALGSSHILGKTNSVMFLASNNENENKDLYSLLNTSSEPITKLRIFGGNASVTDKTADSLLVAIS